MFPDLLCAMMLVGNCECLSQLEDVPAQRAGYAWKRARRHWNRVLKRYDIQSGAGGCHVSETITALTDMQDDSGTFRVVLSNLAA
jgi:hypothetical protein